MTSTQLIKQELLAELKLLKMNATARAIGNNITEVVLYVAAKAAMNNFIEVADDEIDELIEKNKKRSFSISAFS